MSLSRLAKELIQGAQDAGQSLAAYPVVVAGTNSSSVIRTLRLDDNGQVIVVGDTTNPVVVQGAAAEGSAPSGNPVYIAARDSAGNLKSMRFNDASNGNMCVALRSATASANVSGLGDAESGVTILSVGARTSLWDGNAAFNRQRGNTTLALLASAARTATTPTADQTNYNGRGVILFLDVTSNPGAARTLTLNLQYRDETSGNYITVATSGAIAVFGAGAAATGTEVICFYPGAAETAALTGFTTQALPLARSWRVNIVHSDGASWTYSLRGNEIV